WQLAPGVKIILPDIKFQKTTHWISYRKLKGRDLGEIVVSELQGCPKFDDDCRTKIKNFNRKGDEIFEKDFGGESGTLLSLPVISAAAEIDIGTAAEKSTGDVVTLPRPTGDIVIQAPQPSDPTATVEGYKLKDVPTSAADVLNKPVKDLETVIKQIDKN